MNELVFKELNNVKTTLLPEYDLTTTYIHISKQNKIDAANNNQRIAIGRSYIILIADYIINEPDNFTLSTNWNKGTKPPSLYMNIYVTNIIGKMIQINGYAYDITNNVNLKDSWQGWVPEKAIKIIKVV